LAEGVEIVISMEFYNVFETRALFRNLNRLTIPTLFSTEWKTISRRVEL
jgi:hypothetical protein